MRVVSTPTHVIIYKDRHNLIVIERDTFNFDPEGYVAMDNLGHLLEEQFSDFTSVVVV